MNGDEAPRLLYLVLLLLLVGSSLFARRLPFGQSLKMALAWIAIFAAAFVLFALRSPFSDLWSRLRVEATGGSVAQGLTVRIPMAEDGHFWADGAVNGTPVRFLVDSGASTTTVSRTTATAAGLEPGIRRDVVETANGRLVMKKSSAEQFEIGPIERADFTININETDSVNVLGMNFLSSLSRWRVEGRWLILES